MRPDPGRALQESVIASMPSVERTSVVATLRENGRWAIWRQLDAAGLEDPIEVAEFVLRRLYPNESAAWFESVLEQLRAARAAGTWTGFERPRPEHERETSTSL
jgi:hypothetical protein